MSNQMCLLTQHFQDDSTQIMKSIQIAFFDSNVSTQNFYGKSDCSFSHDNFQVRQNFSLWRKMSKTRFLFVTKNTFEEKIVHFDSRKSIRYEIYFKSIFWHKFVVFETYWSSFIVRKHRSVSGLYKMYYCIEFDCSAELRQLWNCLRKFKYVKNIIMLLSFPAWTLGH